MKYFSRAGFLTIPVAIVIAGVIIAFAVVYGTGRDSLGSRTGTAQVATTQEKMGIEDVPSIQPDDHVIGAQNGSVIFIEYSDTECPFCKRYHETLHQAVRDYPNDLVWIYRHYPIDGLHPSAFREAEATECAAEQGGNDGFWKYIDELFVVTPSNNGLDPKELPKIAERVGLKKAEFETCLASGKFKEKIENHRADALAAGGAGVGTPFTVVIAPNNQRFTINGAEPYSNVKKVIDFALKLK